MNAATKGRELRSTSKMRRRALARLNETQVASPCRVRWDEMEGNDRVRFCGECRLHVYNLSAMDVEEAAEIIARNDDRPCVRFYRRADGTLLTQDCPVGAEERGQRRREAVHGTLFGLLGVTLMLCILSPTVNVARPAAKTVAMLSVIKQNDVPELRRMLDAGFDPNGAKSIQRKPLMLAAELGRLEMVRLLLERGADPNRRDKEGRAALDCASKNGHSRVAAILRRAGATESPGRGAGR